MGWRIYADTDGGGMVRRDLTTEQKAGLLEVIAEDGSASILLHPRRPVG